MRRSTARRVAAALEQGWGFLNARPPLSETSRGSIWYHEPPPPGRGVYDQWRVAKGSGKAWLEEALDDAGVPDEPIA